MEQNGLHGSGSGRGGSGSSHDVLSSSLGEVRERKKSFKGVSSEEGVNKSEAISNLAGDKNEDSVFQIGDMNVDWDEDGEDPKEDPLFTIDVEPDLDYQKYLWLKRAQYALKIITILFWVFAIVSVALGQYGMCVGILLYPIGFVGLFKWKYRLTTIFLFGSMLDVLVMLLYSVFTNQTQSVLYIIVEFLVILLKGGIIYFLYLYWQKLPIDDESLSKFSPATDVIQDDRQMDK